MQILAGGILQIYPSPAYVGFKLNRISPASVQLLPHPVAGITHLRYLWSVRNILINEDVNSLKPTDANKRR